MSEDQEEGELECLQESDQNIAPKESKNISKGTQFPLIISDLPENVSLKQIKELFLQYAEVTSVSFLVPNIYGVSQGDVLVVLMDKDAGRKVMKELHKKYVFGHEDEDEVVKGNPISVKFYDEEYYNPSKLYVSHLSQYATEDDLEDIFSPYGHIESINVLKMPDGTNKGCGFVKYSKNEAAVKAIQALHHRYQMPNSVYNLIVKFAGRNDIDLGTAHRNKSKRKNDRKQPVFYEEQAHSTQSQQYIKNYNEYVNYYTALSYQQNATFYNSQQQQQQQVYSQQPQQHYGKRQAQNTSFIESPNAECNIYVANIPLQYAENDLETMFSPFGKIKSVYILIDRPTGLSKGCGFISFDNAESASLSIRQMDGMIIGSKKLRVSIKKKNSTL